MNPQALLNVIQAEELVERLRLAANRSSEIHRSMAEAKSLRQESNHERRTDLYMWPEAAQTIEGQAADCIKALLSSTADLTRQLAVAREALETIAQNDEYPVDADGEPMPIRPQWSSHQCSTIARQALAHITSKEEHHG